MHSVLCLRCRATMLPVLLVLGAVLAVTTSCRDEGCTLHGSYWAAGKKDEGKEGNNIWIEFNSIEPHTMAIYRDNDNDGFVDEVLYVIDGQTTGVNLDTDHDSYLDTEHSFFLTGADAPQVTHIAKETPEAGPFSSEQMDERSRQRPLPRQSRIP